MEIRIGIQQVSREIIIESELTAAQVSEQVNKALEGATLDLQDTKGRRVLVPSAKLAYVEIGEENRRRVGFGTE